MLCRTSFFDYAASHLTQAASDVLHPESAAAKTDGILNPALALATTIILPATVTHC
jgi:hypothetical protein